MMLTLKHTIGKGAFCKVVLAEGVYDSGDIVPYALKVYSKSNLNHEVSSSDPTCLKIIKEVDRLLETELPLWGLADHPNVVKAFTLFQTEDCDSMYLMMQYADLGSIASYDNNKFIINPKVYDCVKAKVGDDRE
jgi:serine/threonine protein kinase